MADLTDYDDVDSTTTLSERDIRDVMREISTLVAKYRQLGQELGVPAHELERLQMQYGFNIDQAFNDMVLLWLRGRAPRTWQALVKAVADPQGVNDDALAKKIAARHKAGRSNPQVSRSRYFCEAEKTAGVPFLYHHLLECDSAGREWTNVDHDITVRIPEGAVAEGEKIHFEVGVAMYGPFIFPDNTQPISPILWLCLLEENVQLKKPFQIVLPHYLTGLSKDRVQHHHIRFAKASHNDFTKVGDQMMYEFQSSKDTPLLATTGHKSYGVHESKHCCFLCLVDKKTCVQAMDSGYCLVQVDSKLHNTVFFSAVYFSDTCLKSLEKQFPKEEGFAMSYQSFKFSGADKKLHIKVGPPSDSSQCLIALKPTDSWISAEDINFGIKTFEELKTLHERKMYPPRVQLSVSLRSSECIKVPIKFTGCSSDSRLDMELIFPLVNTSSSACGSREPCTGTMSQAIRSSGKVRLINKNLPIIVRRLKVHAAKWRVIGLHLGYLSGELDNIEATPSLMLGAPLTWLTAMLERWIQWAPGDGRGSADFATLEDLKDALCEAGLAATAHDLNVNT